MVMNETEMRLWPSRKMQLGEPTMKFPGSFQDAQLNFLGFHKLGVTEVTGNPASFSTASKS